MKRAKVSWSNWVDSIQGPCAVCGKDVFFVVPSDRPDPAILYHITCDVMPLLREQLKKASPPPLPASYVISKPKPAPVAAASVPAAAVKTAPAAVSAVTPAPVASQPVPASPAPAKPEAPTPEAK